MTTQKKSNLFSAKEEDLRTRFRPSEFMRARHPSLFSDSTLITGQRLTRDAFENYLDNLTHRKQEYDFEYFARKLAEKELCPNLLPQTGPTGGGDSKVDTETYPVSEEIALRWYISNSLDASQERWAFAFSTMKAWQPKLKSDINKIVTTDRGYKVIYFISNQFIEDKKRAKYEDELTKQYGVIVRILDRSWIVKCVFENDRTSLAIEALKITGYDDYHVKKLGPKDTSRLEELNQLEKKIEDPDYYRGVYYQLAEDSLKAALLARSLEFPRVEIDGRFDRAERFAKKINYRQQLLNIIYNRAWTTHWWYEDLDCFNNLYDQVEQLALESEQSTDLELLMNLWNLLFSDIRMFSLDKDKFKLKERADKLKTKLQRLASDLNRPNNALHSRANLLLIKLTEARFSGKTITPNLSELKKVLKESQGLAEFPLDTYKDIILELGEFFDENEEFEDLFETAIKITEKRMSAGETGIALKQRGYQKLKANHTYDAIKLFGRAQHNLALDEYKNEWVSSIIGCGLAYERAGLLWAARANILMAANIALSDYWKQGKITPLALRMVQKLVWLELQLGRLPYILAWLEFAEIIASNILVDDEEINAYNNERDNQDIVLGMLLLKSDLWSLNWLTNFPDVLEEQGLFISRVCLLYAMGYEDVIRQENNIPVDYSAELMNQYFQKLLDQPANMDIPDIPDLLIGERIILKSFVMGCEVKVEAANNPVSISLGEVLLSTLEALLSTCLDERVMPLKPELTIKVYPSEFQKGMPEFVIDEETGGEIIKVRHPKVFSNISHEGRKKYHDWIANFMIEIMCQIIYISDLENFLQRIMKDEYGMERGIDFADTDLIQSNLLGNSPKIQIFDWKSKIEKKQYLLLREQIWNNELNNLPKETEDHKPIKFGEGEPPADLFGIDGLKHKDQRIISLINFTLWDMAKWKGVFYLQIPNTFPMLGLGFTNIQAGMRIFKGLKNRLGEIDVNDLLRISIITGVSNKFPSNYRVVISTNLDSVDQIGRRFITVSRCHDMEPKNLSNLNNFLHVYKQTGKYVFLLAHISEQEIMEEPLWDFGIVKHKLIIREAWEIGPNDQDVVAIHEDDDPIIPSGITDAPVIRSLQRFTNYQKRRKRH